MRHCCLPVGPAASGEDNRRMTKVIVSLRIGGLVLKLAASQQREQAVEYLI
jgi:hypothetical protein